MMSLVIYHKEENQSCFPNYSQSYYIDCVHHHPVITPMQLYKWRALKDHLTFEIDLEKSVASKLRCKMHFLNKPSQAIPTGSHATMLHSEWIAPPPTR